MGINDIQKMKHSPTPWKIENMGDDSYSITDANNFRIIEFTGITPKNQMLANIYFIVETVNKTLEEKDART